LPDVPTVERLVDEEPDQQRRHHREGGDDDDGDQNPGQPLQIWASVAPNPLEEGFVDVRPVSLLVVLEVTPPATTVKYDSSPLRVT
jgi:hypothetical protein